MHRRNERTKRIKYIKTKDIFACLMFLFMVPIALIAKIFVHDFWLVGEEENEARDNGYWFFKYVRENHPKQRIAYVINKRCADYDKVKDLGKTIQWGGISHWFWYLTAKKNISSQKGCKPNAAACYLFEVKLRLWRNKRYFLQHGITKDDLDWLYYKNCRFKLFVCGAIPEYEFIKRTFGYPENVVKYLGFARFDNLKNATNTRKQILVMPTWREYLVRPSINVNEEDLKKQFKQSEYFNKWSEFLCSEKLAEILVKSGYTLLFYPHRNMQRYLQDFGSINFNENVKIANPETLSVQTALMESKCLITDFSSVFFDFAYMCKPIIFYQFDENEFRAKQYKNGYFDYHDNPLGKWSGTLDDCIEFLKDNIAKDFPSNPDAKKYFAYNDGDNCKRIYEQVKLIR